MNIHRYHNANNANAKVYDLRYQQRQPPPLPDNTGIVMHRQDYMQNNSIDVTNNHGHPFQRTTRQPPPHVSHASRGILILDDDRPRGYHGNHDAARATAQRNDRENLQPSNALNLHFHGDQSTIILADAMSSLQLEGERNAHYRQLGTNQSGSRWVRVVDNPQENIPADIQMMYFVLGDDGPHETPRIYNLGGVNGNCDYYDYESDSEGRPIIIIH